MPLRRIKIGTYNVNNFFDRFDDPYNYGDDRWGARTTDPKKLDQIFDLGQRLREDKPDILGLQEVENKGALYEFNVSHLGGHFQDLLVIDGNDPRGIQIGLASKFPLGQVASYQFLRDIGDQHRGKIFSRDLIEVEILDPDSFIPMFTVFVTHLKSKFVDPSEKDKAKAEQDAARRRTRQAMAIAQIIKRRFPNPQAGLFVLLGDFNDTPDSAPLSPLLRDPQLGLFDVLSTLPVDNRWTHYWAAQKEHSQIDYILLSPAMQQRMVQGTAQVVQKGYTGGSDHRPAYVDLMVGWE